MFPDEVKLYIKIIENNEILKLLVDNFLFKAI
jgi:hypothetical protein